MGQAMALIAMAFGVAFIVTGLGLVWVAMPKKPESAALTSPAAV